ncbi:MAG: hypothetical protein Q8N13_10550 [Acidovorax sp.]|nr:hypothetical protein [Acidovorax sp.]
MLARQVAWASVRPEDAKGKKAELCRMEQIELDGGTLEMPELSMPYLWAYLQDVGLCERGDMGPRPLSSTELQAWAKGSGLQLDAWEFRALRKASRAFVAQLGSDDTQPPYGDPETLADPDVVEQRMAQILDSLAKPVEKKNADRNSDD